MWLREILGGFELVFSTDKMSCRASNLVQSFLHKDAKDIVR